MIRFVTIKRKARLFSLFQRAPASAPQQIDVGANSRIEQLD
ncbi:MAG TPA: hypothetical protein VGF59_34080 [Bryobacteraceae bacterium]|jgi:hypothetical protein